MENDVMKLLDEMRKVQQECVELRLMVLDLTHRVEGLEDKNEKNGVYLTGSPKYVRDYVDEIRKKEKGV